MANAVDIKFLKKTLTLAARGRGQVSPNPMVGAIIVKNGEIIGKGWHKKCGSHHAEVNAFLSAKVSVKGATLYCSLEPCCHTNKRTPPCVDLIIKKGIKRVCIASNDANSKVNGKGVAKLRRAGIDVQTNLLEEEENFLNEIFRKNIIHSLPFIHLKVAQTLDGKIATNKGDSKWITSPELRKEAHKIRGMYDGLCVGKNTLIQDNPTLNVRYGLENKYSNPKLIVFGHPEEFSKNSIFFKTRDLDDIIFFSNKYKNIKTQNVFSYSSPKQLLKKIFKSQIYSFSIEGGSQIYSYFLKNNFVDKMTIMQAPKILGCGLSAFDSIIPKNMKSAVSFNMSNIKKYNQELMIELYPKR
jgi:diaminohydroxyphosphoribosylaminopyrimidine deaminase/5-amino-6-(5-phosphoribosylamino)uracil reductase